MDSAWFVGLATIIATLCGPIFAVQVQKYLERKNGIKDQKMRIFSALMATRATRLSPDHVQALNMIDLAFNGGSNRQRKSTETDVLDAWRDYLDHLTSEFNETTMERWNEKQGEHLILLLSAMATDLGLRYDRVLLRNGAYMPRGLTNMEQEQHHLRQLAIKVLSGAQPLSMNVTDFPMDPAIVNSQLDLQKNLSAAFNGTGSLSVKMSLEAGEKSAEFVLPKNEQLNGSDDRPQAGA